MCVGASLCSEPCRGQAGRREMPVKQVSWFNWGPSYHKVSRREEQKVPFEGSADTSVGCVRLNFWDILTYWVFPGGLWLFDLLLRASLDLGETLWVLPCISVTAALFQDNTRGCGCAEAGRLLEAISLHACCGHCVLCLSCCYCFETGHR